MVWDALLPQFFFVRTGSKNADSKNVPLSKQMINDKILHKPSGYRTEKRDLSMTFQYVMMANYSMYRKLLMRKLSDTGLTAGQPKILDYLREHNGASQKEIAAANMIEPASLTSLLNGMEKKGMVERRRGNNRRTYYIYLTEEGEKLCRRVTQAFEELRRETFTDADRGTGNYAFEKELEEIYRRLKNMMEEQ